jgi:hypothetical protein
MLTAPFQEAPPRARAATLRAAGRDRLERYFPSAPTGRHGSPEVEFLRSVVAGYRSHGEGPVAVLRYGLRHPPSLVRAALLLARLPRREALLSGGVAGRVIARRLLRRLGTFAGWRRASAVLALPADEASYLRGKSRQALRTNVTRAREAGVICRAVPDVGEQASLVATIAAARGPSEPLDYLMGDFVGVDAHEFFVAQDRDGGLINLCVAVIDVDVALIAYHVSLPGHPEMSNGRYMMSLHLINECIRRGARLLLIETSPLDLDPGLAYYQRRLGFTVCNLRVRHDALPAPAP